MRMSRHMVMHLVGNLWLYISINTYVNLLPWVFFFCKMPISSYSELEDMKCRFLQAEMPNTSRHPTWPGFNPRHIASSE